MGFNPQPEPDGSGSTPFIQHNLLDGESSILQQATSQANGQFLPATERAIYLTSHLQTDLGLKSTHPKNPNLPLTEGWTMNLHQASRSLE